MPVRGRPERPHASALEDAVGYGLDGQGGSEIGLDLVAFHAPFAEIGLDLVAVAPLSQDVGLDLVAVKPHAEDVGLALNAVEFDSGDWTAEAVGLDLVAITAASYAGAPRLRTASSVSVGQESQRRGQVQPSDD